MSEKTRNIIVLGSRGVGKSAITLRYVNNDFPKKHFPTVSNNYTKKTTINSGKFDLNITDTAGMDKPDLLIEQYAVGVDGYVYVFDVTEAATFENLKVINIKVAAATFGNNIPKVLVANKCDLSGERAVSKDDGMAFAQELKCDYVEASAKTNTNIDTIFQKLVTKMNDGKKPKKFCKIF